MARIAPKYRCVLLDRDGSPQTTIHLVVESDSDAILAGNALAREAAQSFEIHEGDRLVYMQKSSSDSPSGATAAA